MLKVFVELWDKNKNVLEKALRNIDDIRTLEYHNLVQITFEGIYNHNNNVDVAHYKRINIGEISEIDNGDYQGTLLYLIPFDTYQPDESDYLMTYVGYGSCSGCDTLLSIIDSDNEQPTDKQVKDLMVLCKDIITNTIKPYNCAWRKNEIFDTVEIND